MSAHPSDALVASLVRTARAAARTNPYPTRTRALGAHGLRQCSAGRLVVESARCERGVSDEVAYARREMIAAELERRRMTEAAEAARRQADLDRERAERERDEAIARSRRQGGPDEGLAVVALASAATLVLSESELIDVIDRAALEDPNLSAEDAAELAGERLIGLTPAQLSEELATAGAAPEVADGLPHMGLDDVSPAELVGRGLDAEPMEAEGPAPDVEVEASPEVG